jgi:VanZ family protein
MDLLSSRKNVLGLICLVITAVIFLAGLWPFNFFPENKVRWLKEQNGVEFYGQAIVFSQHPTRYSLHPSPNSLHAAPYTQYPFSLELYLQSTTEEPSHLGHIFSFLDEHGSETFFVAQWRSHLLLGKGIHGKKNYREIGIRDVLKKGDKRFVTITLGVDGTNIYVDGTLMKSNPRFHLFSMDEEISGRIVLGNSPRGSEYWTGNLLGLSIYDRVLTGEEVSQHFPQNFDGPRRSGEEAPVSLYLFDEHSGTLAHDSVGDHHLVIPAGFEVLKKTILVPPWEDLRFTRSYLMDILTNILGFIPFGFFFSAYLRTRRPLTTFRILLQSLIIAGCISLLIELLQVYLPTRNSQLMDVITNIMGAMIGAILFSKYYKKLTWNPPGASCKL